MNNRARWGGGIGMCNGSSASEMNTAVNGSILTGNAASGDLGGGISVEGTGVDKTTLQFDSDCAIYDNTAAIGADDVYKDGTSTINNLPTAEQMNGTHSGANLSGWYWDYKTINGTYEYPEDVTHPCARYDSTTNAVVYTPVSSEMAERYLKAVQITDFRVQFDKNCTDTVNDMPATQSVAPGQTADEPTDPPTRDGYVFDGWYKESTCNTPWNFNTDTVTSDIILYAKWLRATTPITPTTAAYKVEHYKEQLDGTYQKDAAEDELRFGGLGTSVTATAKTFDHYTYNEGISQVTGEVIAPTVEDGVLRLLTLKVYYDLDRHTVTFDGRGGSAVSSQNVKHGHAAVEPVAPARDDYEFAGWYKDALCTQRYDFSSPVTANITLYAKWVQGLPHYILQYGDGRPGDGGDQYTFPYDPASPEKLPTEVKYFSQEEIEQLPEQSIYEGVTMEGTYFLAWYGYMPALASAINNNFPVLEKTGENTYTEFSGTPAAGTTYFQFIPCETTPDTNLGDIIYYAQWVKVKVDIEVDIKVDVDVSFSENLGGKVVMIDDSQKLVLAKNFRPSDIVSNNCEITLTATVANPKIPAEEAKTAEYMAQNYPNCRSISYDVEITKDIVSGGSPYSSETLKKLAAPIEIRFAVPNEWRNGTVKMLRAHTDPGTGTVTVSECQNLSSDKSWFILSSDEFSTYTLLYIPSGGGTGGSGGGTSAYTLRYQSNGGTPCPDETKTSAWSKDYDSLPVPVREGYLFTGWFADSGLQTPISEDVQVNRRLVTIYAGWEKSMVPAMLNGDDHYAYVQGYSDGTVRPNDNITRAEVATIFFRLLKDEIREENLSDVNTFEDVTDGMWCNKAISTMAVLGVVKGRTAEYFDPDAPITRGEFAAICSRFDKSDIVARENFTDIEGYWAKEEIERAAILGWVRGYTDGSFRPRNYITRAEAMTMINRVLHRVPESPEDLLPDMVTWPDNKLTDWYYLAVQEATNSHIPERKVNGYESWFALTYNRDWSIYQS